MQDFAHLSPEQWPIVASVDWVRAKRLLAPPSYGDLVRNLVARAAVLGAELEPAKGDADVQRLHAVLKVDPVALDEFFNSTAGYRAQYFSSEAMGEAANRQVVDALVPIVLPVINAGKDRTNASEIMRASLKGAAAKLWIYQGAWLRLCRRDDRVLQVPRWQEGLESQDKRLRKLARWGSLAPANEYRVQLKGAFIRDSSVINAGKATEARSREIHSLGFT